MGVPREKPDAENNLAGDTSLRTVGPLAILGLEGLTSDYAFQVNHPRVRRLVRNFGVIRRGNKIRLSTVYFHDQATISPDTNAPDS